MPEQMSMTNSIRAVLFDLDGTLLDTAPDLIYALNCLRQHHGLTDLSLADMRPIANLGSKALVCRAFDIKDDDAKLSPLREEFLNFYEQHITRATQFFPHIENVLLALDQRHIPWGIVTNKLKRHTHVILERLQLSHRPACIVCGDTLSKSKPDPAPIRYACELLNQEPADCVYIGDAITDVMASKAAGTKALVALYGYIHANEDPFEWKADGYIKKPEEILDALNLLIE